MKIVDVTSPGGPDQLAIVERDKPTVGDHDVLIKVAAAGLNRADILQRKGAYPSPPGAPTNPGLEAAGTIESIGKSVASIKVGDQVCALLQGGGYSEYVAVHEGQVLPVPRGFDLDGIASCGFAIHRVPRTALQAQVLDHRVDVGIAHLGGVATRASRRRPRRRVRGRHPATRDSDPPRPGREEASRSARGAG